MYATEPLTNHTLPLTRYYRGEGFCCGLNRAITIRDRASVRLQRLIVDKRELMAIGVGLEHCILSAIHQFDQANVEARCNQVLCSTNALIPVLREVVHVTHGSFQSIGLSFNSSNFELMELNILLPSNGARPFDLPRGDGCE